MRLNSKKFEQESDNKIASFSKSTDYEIQLSDKKVNIPKFGGFSGIKNEIGGGFYIKSKPLKSPGTPSSSGSQSINSKPQFGAK